MQIVLIPIIPMIMWLDFNDDAPGSGGMASQMAANLSAGTIYYLITVGNQDPFGFGAGGEIQGTFTTNFSPGISPFLQVYDVEWIYGFQGF